MLDTITDDASLRWGDSTTSMEMLEHWYQITLDETKAFQRDTNLFASEEDMASSDWMKDLLVNSREASLTQRVDEKYQALDSLEQGGITYLNLILDEMFCMTNNMVSALQTFLKTFADFGLTKTVGENVAKATAQVKAFCERLSNVNQLPQEAPTFVLQGLTKCSVPELTGPFTLI